MGVAAGTPEANGKHKCHTGMRASLLGSSHHDFHFDLSCPA